MEKTGVKVLFGHRVRELRRRRGWSQESFAQKIGLDRSYMGGVERGERNISIENIALIAKGLEVSLSVLFDFSEQLANEQLDIEVDQPTHIPNAAGEIVRAHRSRTNSRANRSGQG